MLKSEQESLPKVPASQTAQTVPDDPSTEDDQPSFDDSLLAAQADELQVAGFDDLLTRLRVTIKGIEGRDEVMAALESIASSRPALAIELAQVIGRTDEEKAEWVTF